MTTFDEAWAKKVTEGYQYGPDALEQVRFGWEIHEAEIAAAEADAMALLARGVELFGEDDEKIKRLEARVAELEAQLIRAGAKRCAICKVLAIEDRNDERTTLGSDQQGRLVHYGCMDAERRSGKGT